MPDYRTPDGRVPVLVSADAAELLVLEARAIAAYVAENTGVTARDVAAHLFRTRPARRHRAVVLCAPDVDGGRRDLIDGLQALADGTSHPALVVGREAARNCRVAYVFPGQGSQRPGMGAMPYRHSRVYRDSVDACHEASMRLFGRSPRDYILGKIADDDPVRDDIRYIQPGLFMHMVALAAMWDDAGASPAMTVGHSQGEIAAAYRSGVMTLDDSLTIVTGRAEMVQENSPRGYTMAVLGVDVDTCEQILARHSGWAQLSVVNSPHILCISGERGAVLDIIETLTADGIFAKEIRVEYPAHTSIVSEFFPAFCVQVGPLLGEKFLFDGEVPCYSAAVGGPMDSTMPMLDYWFWNLRNRVRFDLAVKGAADAGATHFIEIAEHPTLALAMAENLADHSAAVLPTSRREAQDLAEFTANLAGLAVVDNGFRWERLAVDDGGRSPLPLEGFPNTAWRRVSLWADRSAGENDPVNVPAWGARMARRGIRRLQVQWQPMERRELLAPRRIGVIDPTGDHGALAAEICALAPVHGAIALRVDDASPEEIAQIDTAVVLVGGQAPGDGPTDAATRLAAVLADGAWRRGLESLPEQFWVVTVGGEQVNSADPVPDDVNGTVVAALRCVAVEHLGTRVRHVDLDPNVGKGRGDQILAAVHVAAEPDIAIRSGQSYVKRLVPAPVQGPVEQDLRHVVITGGTGTLGLALAAHYAAAGASRISLLSRSGAADPAVAARLDALRRTGTDVEALVADLTDPGSVAAAVCEWADGPSLLIHTAFTYVGSSADEITAADLASARAAKVDGLTNVLSVLPAPPEQVVAFSSIAATIGGRNQAVYAATNRALELAAARLREQSVSAAAIGWGLWQVQGPVYEGGAEQAADAGARPMPVATAITVGLADLSEDAVVAGADWAQLRTMLSVVGADRLLREVPDADDEIDDGPVVEAPTQATAVEPAAIEPEAPAEAEPSDQPSATPGAASGGPLIGELSAELAAAMGLGRADAAELDPHLPLVALGLDSLQALDFRKRVKTSLNQELPVEAILGGASLHEVVELMENV